MSELDDRAKQIENEHREITFTLIGDGKLASPEIDAARIAITLRHLKEVEKAGRIAEREQSATLRSQVGELVALILRDKHFELEYRDDGSLTDKSATKLFNFVLSQSQRVEDMAKVIRAAIETIKKES